MGDALDTDLALTEVYSILDRADLQMQDICKDLIYGLIRLAYHTGKSDGIFEVSETLRENGYGL